MTGKAPVAARGNAHVAGPGAKTRAREAGPGRDCDGKAGAR